jgi:hypothetical protein
LDGVIARPVLRSLLAALRLRDAATIQHVRRSAQFATGLARFIDWDGVSLRRLEIASLLHDIGKHVGIDVQQACQVHQEVLEIFNQSTPNYDAGQHSGKELHLGARIQAIADAYDSLSHKQVYRDAKTHAEILSILSGSAESRFDGNLVSVMNRWIQAEGTPFSRDLQEAPTPNSGAPIVRDHAPLARGHPEWQAPNRAGPTAAYRRPLVPCGTDVGAADRSRRQPAGCRGNLSQDRRRRAEDKNLRKQAIRDALTGVFNRGELERTLESLISDFNRDSVPEPMSLIFLDVDNSKRINDTLLHLTGDQVLIGLAKLVQSETYFQVQMRPNGWPPDVATFQERARNTFRLLKSYFVADY